MRSGNIQIGTNGILEDLFIETRFNSWCVGEIHVIDSRIIPNGRRDHYEQNVHYTNLINQLSPIAREIVVEGAEFVQHVAKFVKDNDAAGL